MSVLCFPQWRAGRQSHSGLDRLPALQLNTDGKPDEVPQYAVSSPAIFMPAPRAGKERDTRQERGNNFPADSPTGQAAGSRRDVAAERR
jgi:hypothetical protein